MTSRKTLGIIGGKGRMGVVLADFFAQKGFNILISDLETEIGNTEVAERSDILILSVPISQIEKVVVEVAPFLKKSALLMDVSSVKKAPLEAMMRNFSGAVLATHPMCAPHNFGAGQTIVLCLGRDDARKSEIAGYFSDWNIVEITADEHDRAMGIVQGIEHLMKIAFAKTIVESGLSLDLLKKVQSPIYRFQMALIGRILFQDEKLYSEISFGSEATRIAISEFSRNVDFFAHSSREEFERAFCVARNFFGENCEIGQRESDAMIDLFTNTKMKVGVLGPPGTFSNIACSRFLIGEMHIFFPDFLDIFAALQKGEIDSAFVPVKTSARPVAAVEKLQKEYHFPAEKFFDFPVEYSLVGRRNRKITRIFGRDEALVISADFLEKNFPNAERIPTKSSVAALEKAKENIHSGAICAAENAKGDLEKIASAATGITRFALLKRASESQSE